MRTFKRTTWRTDDAETAAESVVTFIPQQGFVDLGDVIDSITSFQEEWRSEKSRSERRASREGKCIKQLRARLIEWQQPDVLARERQDPQLAVKNEGERRNVVEQIQLMKVQECRAARLLQQRNRIRAERTLTKSKKLVDIGEMKSAVSGQRNFSNEEKIEEVIATFKQCWCASDDEEDYNTCCDFLRHHDEVMLAYSREVDESGLRRVKKKHYLELYGVSGSAILLMMKEPKFADALNLYIAQAAYFRGHVVPTLEPFAHRTEEQGMLSARRAGRRHQRS